MRLGAGASGLLIPVRSDTKSCWVYPAAERSPTRRPAGDARRPAGGGGTTRRAARREAVPWGALGNQGTVRPPVWRGYPSNFQANRPAPRAEGLYRDARADRGTTLTRRAVTHSPGLAMTVGGKSWSPRISVSTEDQAWRLKHG
jgi:hypothetical protein